MFLIAPIVMGSVFSIMDGFPIVNEQWQLIYETNEDNAKLLVNLIPTFGVFLIVIKVLMVASVQGRE